ncbi:MAG: PEP-CTERM sorting domain-containing protein, partial [Kiritimatiellales bacterium]|nr:PEP-CTERM sorting domain-containing protein [Kiritimatiellales bacterium]
ITTSLFVLPSVVEQWTTSFSAPAGLLAFNDNIVTVLFNATTLEVATNWKYDTAFTFTSGSTGPGGSAQLPGSNIPGSYTVTGLSTWQAVPEPATFALFGIGGVGAWIIRRNKLKAKEEADA